MREVLPSVEHRQPRYLHNRAEHSHQPTRQRERRMQRFLAVYGPIASHFRPRRHLLPAPKRFRTWREMTGTAIAAQETGETSPTHPCAC
jgi:putative transposase